MRESTDSSRTTIRSRPRCPLSISGLSRFLLPTFLCGKQRKVGAAPHRGNTNRPLTKQGKAPKPEQGTAPNPDQGTAPNPSFNPQNPPSKPLRVSGRNSIRRHLSPGIPLPGTPLQHTLLKLRDRIRIPSIPLGDSPKRRPDLGRINRMTSAASLLASRDRTAAPRRRSERTPTQHASQRSNQNHPSHNVTP
ncbi:hypothetical protein LMG24238_07512 [Paraburkholderia sediminicola]|uniref:Uncharacterized protein n=1 Tax=Paraburkholderia sediminicola TaxID=458836 RepID=A0A6J5CV36_9BURK|nr:hypothetical protein LMG24238_07512 [Paraburkholderia sediminicola]